MPRLHVRAVMLGCPIADNLIEAGGVEFIRREVDQWNPYDAGLVAGAGKCKYLRVDIHFDEFILGSLGFVFSLLALGVQLGI